MRRTSLACLAASLCTACLALASCSDDAPGAGAADAGDEPTAQRRPPLEPEPESDAGLEAGPPPVIVPSCVGSSMPLAVAGRRAYVDVKLPADGDAGDAGASVGSFVVDFGTTGSTIDLGAWDDAGAGPPPHPSSCSGDASAPGAFCQFASFDFFGDWGTVTLRTDSYATLFAAKRQAGIIATDFLSVRPFTLDYRNQRLFTSDSKTFCTQAQLLAAGFRPLPADGFYASDLSKLRPLSDVLDDPDGGTAGFTVPNVPTVPVAIAGVDALAQLDTGYEDRLVPHSININDALYAKITAKDPTILDRDTARDVFATTCVPGYSEPLRAYRLKAGATIDFVAEGGTVARSESTAEIYVKSRSDQTRPCGGISTWTAPAAQIGSSFYEDAQVIVFDPIGSRVWVPKN